MTTSEKKRGLIWDLGQSSDLLGRARPGSGSRCNNMRRTSALTAISTMLMVGVSACGGEGSGAAEDKSYADESPKTIVADAKAAMSGLKTVHLGGSGVDDGDTVTFDLSLSTAGDCSGTLGLPDGALTLLVIGGESWFKGDKAFWTSSAGGDAAGVMDMVGNKWVVGGKDLGDMSELCDWDQFSGDFLGMLEVNALQNLTIKATEDEIDGQPVVKLEDRSSDLGAIYVSAEEPHHVVKVTNGGKEKSDLTFSAFDEPLDLKPPPPKRQIDFNNMG